MWLFRTQQPSRKGPMTSISKVRAEVHRELQELVGVAERPSPQTATDVEVAVWVGMLRLGASLMRLFFAHQTARWPCGFRYDVAGVPHEIEGADAVEVGTKFGKISVSQPIGRAVGQRRARRDL